MISNNLLSNKKTLIIALVVFLVILLSVGVYFVNKSNLDGRSDASSSGLEDNLVYDDSIDLMPTPSQAPVLTPPPSGTNTPPGREEALAPEDQNNYPKLQIEVGSYIFAWNGITRSQSWDDDNLITSLNITKQNSDSVGYYMEVRLPDGTPYNGYLDARVIQTGDEYQKWGNYEVKDGFVYVPSKDQYNLPTGYSIAQFKPYQDTYVPPLTWSNEINVNLLPEGSPDVDKESLVVAVGLLTNYESKMEPTGTSIRIPRSGLMDGTTSYYLKVVFPVNFEGPLEAYIPSTGQNFKWYSATGGLVKVPSSDLTSLPDSITKAQFRGLPGVGSNPDFDKYATEWSNPITVEIYND